MSTKRFCDVCEEPIDASVTSARVKESMVVRGKGVHQTSINVEIMCGVGGPGQFNSGDLCLRCLFTALDRFDPRPRAAAGLAES